MSDTTTTIQYTAAYDSLPDSVKQIVDEAIRTYQEQQPKTEQNPGEYLTPIVLLAFAIYGVILARKAWRIKGRTIVGGWRDTQQIRNNINYQHPRQQLESDYFVYEGRDIVVPDEQYQKILNKYSPYYRRLSPELKEKFLDRLKEFVRSKTFLIKSNDPFIEMPVLLSANAVQLTFGLKDYLLPHYQYIRIYPEEYFASDGLRVLAGHVYGNTITLAWNQFLKGNEEYTDGVNVGLHEMAHALYFQHVHIDGFRSHRFISSFNKVMEEGEEIYALKQSNPDTLFSKNAYKDLQEFWAESVELFFERPSELKREDEGLYEDLKNILNQDPANSLYPVAN